MNTHVLDPHTDAELRSLDAASDVAVHSDRRDATLNSILKAPSTSAASTTTLVPATRRRPTRRWVAVGAVAAAAAGVAIVLPTLTAAPSYASWTARPDTVTTSDSALVREACLKEQGPSVGDGQFPTAGLEVQLVERRGDYVTMLLGKRGADRTSTSVFCLAKLPSGSAHVSDVEVGATGGGGLPAPQAREFTQGAIAQFGDHGGATITEGEVGKDIIKLTLHAGGTTVDATIANGTYAAWWPGEPITVVDSETGKDTGVRGLTLNDGAITALAYDVTYADGTVAHNVAPATLGGSGEIHTETPPTS